MSTQRLFWRWFLQRHGEAGITLVEVLVAGIIGVLVVLAGGYALVTNLRVDRELSSAAIQRNLQTRALEYISSEVRQANLIYAPNNTPNLCSSYTRVLGLQTTVNGSNRNIVYAVGNANNPWRGDRVLYRCGPPIDTSTGRYSSGSDVEEVILDGLSSATLAANSNGCGAVPTAYAVSSSNTAGLRAFFRTASNVVNTNSAQILLGMQIDRGIQGNATSCASIVASNRSTP
ncbi:PilW family protein [Synechococcus elongatus]|uniref:PilW family protein n=1 Tax=Synechococcus elongatus TaxID=32046 RepID=UPI000F7F6909|nr:hypothetical protein [Synechococcus elongatus]